MLNFSFEYKKMPVLIPIPIKTQGRGYWTALKIWLTQSRKWEIAEEFNFFINGVEYRISEGFIFDGASIPRLFWAVLSPTGILLVPGLVHDYVYRYQGLFSFIAGLIPYTRKQSDQLFREIAISVNGFKAINKTAYFILRSCGKIAWEKNKKRKGKK